MATAISGDTVDVPAGTYTLTLGTQIIIDKDLTLMGAGDQLTIIEAATQPGVADSRVFSLTNAADDVTISGVTIRHGTASFGGGIFINNVTTLTLTNSTVSGNSAAVDGGGISNVDSTLTLNSSIVAVNLSGGDCSGVVALSQGFNLDSDNTCGLTDPTDLPGVDPLLGPLQDNGGPTETHALSPGSLAIDPIPPGSCATATDQRGNARPQGPGCDIGAYEVTKDLVVTSLTTTTTGLIGGGMTVSSEVQNVGTDDIVNPFRLGFYFSTDSTIGTEDTFSGSFCQFAGLAAGQTDNCDLTVDVPVVLPPGTYLLGGIVDDLAAISGDNEFNNTRAADTGPVELSETCALALGLSHGGGNLTMGFELGMQEAAQWDVWLVSIFGVNNLWAAPLPIIDPVVPVPVGFPFPSIGDIGILTTLRTQNGEICIDLQIVDTGGVGASVEELEGLIYRSGILHNSLRR